MLVLEAKRLLAVVSQGLAPPWIGLDVHRGSLVRCQFDGHLLTATGFLLKWRVCWGTKCFPESETRQDCSQREAPEQGMLGRPSWSFISQTSESGSANKSQNWEEIPDREDTNEDARMLPAKTI